MEPQMNVHIDSPDKMIWEGAAASVSSVNTQGPFDILPYHATFVTLIENQPIQIRTSEGKMLKFNFGHSVIFNRDNTVSVYTNI